MAHPSEYPTLFEMHPIGTEPPIAERKIMRGCLLPAPENQFVDVQRAADILNTSKSTIVNMLKSKRLRRYQLGNQTRWMVLYQSIVELCDDLRTRHCIADRRRRRLAPGQRWRDEELLPFPKSDTVTVEDAMKGLNVHRKIVLHLIEEGQFEAYQLFECGAWRISKSSLFAYRDRKIQQLAETNRSPSH